MTTHTPMEGVSDGEGRIKRQRSYRDPGGAGKTAANAVTDTADRTGITDGRTGGTIAGRANAKQAARATAPKGRR